MVEIDPGVYTPGYKHFTPTGLKVPLTPLGEGDLGGEGLPWSIKQIVSAPPIRWVNVVDIKAIGLGIAFVQF